MDMHAANDNSYIQYLIFYEDLNAHHYEGYKLQKLVQQEIDEIDGAPEDQDEEHDRNSDSSFEDHVQEIVYSKTTYKKEVIK